MGGILESAQVRESGIVWRPGHGMVWFGRRLAKEERDGTKTKGWELQTGRGVSVCFGVYKKEYRGSKVLKQKGEQ